MNDGNLSGRDSRLVTKIERLRRCDDPTVDSPDAQISVLLTGLSEMAALIGAQPQDTADEQLLLEIDNLRCCDNPSVDGPDAQISLLLGGLSGLAVRIRRSAERDAIARIIDDEIWDGDGDYPLDRRRIADRRASAYARADRILQLMGNAR